MQKIYLEIQGTDNIYELQQLNVMKSIIICLKHS